MTDLLAVAIWLAVILLLSLATIPVCARWRKREADQDREANGRGANRSSAYDSTPAVSEGGAQPSKTPVRGLTKGEAPDAVIPVVDLTRIHGRNAGQTGSEGPAVPLASLSRPARPFVPQPDGPAGNWQEGVSPQTWMSVTCVAPGWVGPAPGLSAVRGTGE